MLTQREFRQLESAILCMETASVGGAEVVSQANVIRILSHWAEGSPAENSDDKTAEPETPVDVPVVNLPPEP